MKKRILTIVLALVMVCSLLPVTAMAASYGLSVAGVEVTSTNAQNITGVGISGTVSYDHDTRTLTLNGATIEVASGSGITSYDDLTIKLAGTNTISTSLGNGIDVNNGDLTIQDSGSGNGTLTVIGSGDYRNAIGTTYGNITISSGTVTASITGTNSRGIYAMGGNLTISGDTVDATGSLYGLLANSNGNASLGFININGGTVTAKGGTAAVNAERGVSVANYLGNYRWKTTEGGSMTSSGVQEYSYANNGSATYLKIEPIASAPATLTGTVTITGETKFGSALTATVTGSNNTGTLSYQWYRGGVELTSATSDTYTLVQNDLNEKMKVVVTSSVQTGNNESEQTAVVEKADCLDVPTGLAGVAPTTAGGNNGKITGTTSAMAYSEYSDFRWSTTCDENETRAWHPGTYYVRYRQTDTHKAGTNYATVIVPDLTPAPSTTYRDYLIHSATLSEVQQELNGVADVTSNDGVITIKLTSNINGRLDFDHNSGKFVLDMNGKTIDAGTTNEALCLNNGFTGTVKVIGSGTFKTGCNNIVYGGGKLTIGLSEGKDYFTLVKDGTPVFVDVNTGTTALSTFERGNELVLTQCNGIIRTITFHANGGTGTMAAASALDGTNYTLPSCTFTAPSGKEFKGWATTANGTVLSGTTLAVTANVDLYAIWEETTQGGGNGGGNQGGNNPTPPAPTYPSYNPPVITTPSVDVDDSTLNDAAGALGSAVLDSKAEIVPAAGYTVEKIAKLQSEGKLNLVIDKKASYDAADKALVDAAAAKKAALCTQYLDIDAVLKTDSGEVVATVKNTVKPLTITIALSAEMQQAAKDGKTLLVVRCHEGKCDYLNGTLNAEKTEITIQSAQFSTYAVIAVESDAAKTFDGGIALYGAMALLSVGGGAALVIGKKRKD